MLAGHAESKHGTKAEASAKTEGKECCDHLFLRESARWHVIEVNDDVRAFAVVFDELLNLVNVIRNAVNQSSCK